MVNQKGLLVLGLRLCAIVAIVMLTYVATAAAQTADVKSLDEVNKELSNRFPASGRFSSKKIPTG